MKQSLAHRIDSRVVNVTKVFKLLKVSRICFVGNLRVAGLYTSAPFGERRRCRCGSLV
jgi:hypothetical protein